MPSHPIFSLEESSALWRIERSWRTHMNSCSDSCSCNMNMADASLGSQPTSAYDASYIALWDVTLCSPAICLLNITHMLAPFHPSPCCTPIDYSVGLKTCRTLRSRRCLSANSYSPRANPGTSSKSTIFENS